MLLLCVERVQLKRPQLARYLLYLAFCSLVTRPLCYNVSSLYGSVGYDREEAVQMFEIVDAEHGKLLTGSAQACYNPADRLCVLNHLFQSDVKLYSKGL